MPIHEITLKNFLSFGPDGCTIPLKPLNVIIGPNGSGKSNLLEALALLSATPGSLVTPFREGGGGISEWLWKGAKGPAPASIEVVVDPLSLGAMHELRYRFDFNVVKNRFEIIDERLEYARGREKGKKPQFLYRYEENHPVLNVRVDPKKEGTRRTLRREDIDPERSILAQRRDPDLYPEITSLAEKFGDIRIYRDWTLGRNSPSRIPQPADLPNRWVEGDASNLGLVLNRLKRDGQTRNKIVNYFRDAYEGVVDFEIDVEGGRVQVFVREDHFNAPMPATRLSDGTLRYLCLLAILCDPAPPPLICIDEPELGLHHDLINNIVEAMKDASTRTQLIVTTHSDFLVDALHGDPEALLVCEKRNGCTTIERLDPSG